MERIFYFAQVLDVLNIIIILCLIAFGVLSIGLTIARFAEGWEADCESDKPLIAATKRCYLLVAIYALLAIFVPTKETFLFMVGGRIVEQTIDNHPQVKEIPGNTLELLNEYIKTATEDLREKNMKE